MPGVYRYSSVGRWPIFGLYLAVLIGAGGAAVAAPALPTGGKVTAGTVIIGAPSGARLAVTQTSAKGIVDWSTFSIGKGASVNFVNGSGATLNEVTGGSLSDIEGLLSGSGSVFVINPAGVIVGKSGVVSVGGTFAASTLPVSESEFLSGGPLTFSGSSNAAVVNLGKIGSLGGDVALIGATVSNEGTITAPKGDVGLAAGYEVVLQDQLLDDGKFEVVLGGAGTSAVNAGLIRAAEAELRANGGNVYALAGNTSSVIEATGVSSDDGKVFLIAEGGATEAHGQITATGEVETSGTTVDFTGLKVSASNWLIDPYDLTVDAAAASTIDTALATTNVTLQTTSSGTSGPGNPNPSGVGDINIEAPIAWSSAKTLTLDAYTGINILDPVTVEGKGGLVLITNDGGAGGALSFGLGPSGFTGDVSYTGTPASGQSLTINGAPYTLVYKMSDVEGMSLAGDYALARNINASGYSPAGPIGNLANPFTGDFEGLGNTISNFKLTYSTASSGNIDGYTSKGYVGLFGVVGSTGVLADLELAGAKVTGANDMYVGALAGAVEGKVIDAASTGTVTGGNISTDNFQPGIGGLVGGLGGPGSLIDGSWSSATVTGGAGASVGGLVGDAFYGAAISESSASGKVTTGAATPSEYSVAGGLLGAADGYTYSLAQNALVGVANSSATGPVSGGGGSTIGGFAGEANVAFLLGDDAGGPVSQSAAPTNGANDIAGGFIGMVETGDIYDSYATGAVTQTKGGGAGVLADDIGGFVGIVLPSGYLTQDYSSGAVSTVGGATSANDTAVGGFAGDVASGVGGVANAYSLSPVHSTGANVEAGGFAGVVGVGTVTQVYASGAMTASGTQGGLVGVVDAGGQVMDSYWDEGTTGQTNGYGTNAGTFTSDEGIGGSTGISPYLEATYANFSFGGGNPWVIFDGSTRPMLAMEESTSITNAHQLQLIALDPSADYTLEGNLDLTATHNAADVWNPATGFVPIGGGALLDDASVAAFTGTFEGNGYKISNLFIDYPAADADAQSFFGYTAAGYVGLFGDVGPGGVVQDVTLANANVTGADDMNVGAMIGLLEGSAINDSSSGTVMGGNRSVDWYPGIGGLVGIAAGPSALIQNASSSATVTGGFQVGAGGLVGAAMYGATIDPSSASGNVSGGSESAAGGLVGYIWGYDAASNPSVVTVEGASATGSVSGGAASQVGGFAGQIFNGNLSQDFATGSVTQTSALSGGYDFAGGFAGQIADSTVTQSFSSGAVSTVGGTTSPYETLAGGFVGELESGSITNSYSLSPVAWIGGNIEVGGFAGYSGDIIAEVYAAGGLSGPSPLDAGGLVGSNSGSFTDSYWDEGTTGQTNGYGTNAGTFTSDEGIGGGTGINPYAKATYANFTFAPGGPWEILDGYTRPFLAFQVPASGSTITNGEELQLIALNPGGSYVLGGNVDLSATSNGMGIWNPATGFDPIPNFTGSFSGGGYTISNLYINDPSANDVGLFGTNKGSISAVKLTGASVTGGNDTGLLAGLNTGSVSGSTVSGTTVSGGADVGGFAGANTGSISGSKATTTSVTGTGNDVGGFTGSNTGSVSGSSSSSGPVAGGSGVGGFIGANNGGSISGDTSTTTSVTGTGNDVGGFAGSNSAGSMSGDTATPGTVDGVDDVGGFIGANGGTVSGSTTNTPVVDGSMDVGGFVGDNTGTMSGDTAKSPNVTGTTNKGAVSGANTGTITGSSAPGATVH
jgi:filamentous hemagglutinin family protein